MLHWFFPHLCAVCGTSDWISERVGICHSCVLRKLPEIRNFQSRQLATRFPLPEDRFRFFEGFFALQLKQEWERFLFQKCKFRNAKVLTAYWTLGISRLRQSWKKDPPDACILVPSTPKSEVRPYHVADKLVQRICKKEGIGLVPFFRKNPGKTQASHGFEERFFHAKKAFEVVKNDRTIQGLHILLIDDVYTTGATVNELSRRLLFAGARKITCLVLLVSEEF